MNNLEHLKLIDFHSDVTLPYVVAEGPKIVLRLIESDLKIIKIYADQKQHNLLVQQLKDPKILDSLDINILEKSTVQELAGYKIHQGIMGIAEKPKLLQVEEMRPPFLIFNKLHNAENVGSIIRSANAFGINHFICDKDTSYPYLRRCIRVSMGGALYSKFSIVDSLEKTISYLKQKYSFAALEINEKSKSLYEISEQTKIHGLVVGSEHDGISPNILELCEHTFHIPMDRTNLSSLNVGVASGIAISYLNEFGALHTT